MASTDRNLLVPGSQGGNGSKKSWDLRVEKCVKIDGFDGKIQ